MKTSVSTLTRNEKNINFEVVDNKGRKIGARIITGKALFTELPSNAMSWFENDFTGECFFVNVQKTKDAISFGASQSTKYFLRSQDVDSYITRRINGMSKK